MAKYRLVSLWLVCGSHVTWGQTVQSQIPVRVGDCVKATTDLEFFFKDEGEYERTHFITKGQTGVLLNVDSQWGNPSTVEFIDKDTREPHVSGALFLHQFARVPWLQGRIPERESAFTGGGANTGSNGLTGFVPAVCMTVVDQKDGYQPLVRMQPCNDDDKWKQQFSYNQHDCAARPIRWTQDPSKCLDTVHPRKALLTDCSGVDSQKFIFRCTPNTANYDAISGDASFAAGAPPSQEGCYIQAMGGRKDMCLWWEHNSGGTGTGVPAVGYADLELRHCNFPKTKTFKQNRRPLLNADTREDNK